MKTQTECRAEIKIEVPGGIDVQTTSLWDGNTATREVTIRSYGHSTEEAAELAIVETVRKLAEEVYGKDCL